MTNMNGKIFVHNKTGNKYMVLNEDIDPQTSEMTWMLLFMHPLTLLTQHGMLS